MEAQFGQKAPEAVKKQTESWKKTAERYQSEPETKRRPQGAYGACEGDGEKARPRDGGLPQLRDRLRRRADRDRSRLGPDHHGASRRSSGIAYGLGAIGVAFSLIGFFWPTAVHLF